MSSDIEFGGAVLVPFDDGDPEWTVDWNPSPTENDGTSAEFTSAPGSPFRAHSNADTREWIASSQEATMVAELISLTPGLNDPQVTALDEAVLEAIRSLPDGPDDFCADVSQWFTYWAPADS